ncbi:response regulator [Candidatus Omnitrophota bacterium]
MLFKKRKILIIDDNENLVFFLKKILEHEHFSVFSTTHGQGAVELAVSSKPDVILLDIMIPDKGGAEIEKILKELPLTRHIPIVYMTALVSKEDEELSRQPDQHRLLLSKPVTKERLVETIRLALKR